MSLCKWTLITNIMFCLWDFMCSTLQQSLELWQLITSFTSNQFSLIDSQCSTCSQRPFPNVLLCYSSEHWCHVGPGGLRQSGPLHRSHQGTTSCQKSLQNLQILQKTWTSALHPASLVLLRSARCLSPASCHPASSCPTTLPSLAWTTLARRLALAAGTSKGWTRWELIVLSLTVAYLKCQSCIPTMICFLPPAAGHHALSSGRAEKFKQ